MKLLDRNFVRHIGTYQGQALVREVRARTAETRADNSYALAAIALPALLVAALVIATV